MLRSRLVVFSLALAWSAVWCVAGASVVAIALMIGVSSGALAVVSLSATVVVGVMVASGFKVLRG